MQLKSYFYPILICGSVQFFKSVEVYIWPPLNSVELQHSDFDPTDTTMAFGLTNESAIISYLPM